MDPEVVTIVETVTNIINLIAFLIVLIRLFQRKGALHGILGIITLGIYPFIWGWAKCGVEKLTWVMIIWTLSALGYLGLVVSLMSQLAGEL